MLKHAKNVYLYFVNEHMFFKFFITQMRATVSLCLYCAMVSQTYKHSSGYVTNVCLFYSSVLIWKAKVAFRTETSRSNFKDKYQLPLYFNPKSLRKLL